MKVCTFSYNEVDAYYNTVRRVTRTLNQAGHEVRVVALLGRQSEVREISDGATIDRVALAPLNLKAVRLLDWPLMIEEKAAGLLARRRFPRTYERGERPSGAAARLRSLPRFAVRAFRENPAYFLAVAWIVALAYVALFLPVKAYHVIRRRIVRRLRTGATHRYSSYLDYYYRGFRLARREPFDACHAHDLVTLPVAYVCARLAKAKLVYDAHELWLDRNRERERSRLNRFIVKRIESFLIRRADACIMGGLSGSRELATRYGIEPPLVVLNAPFYRRTETGSLLRDDLGIPQDQRILLCMGRIGPVRGIEEQVLSLKHLSNCVLVIFSFGPDRYISGLREFIRDKDLADRVYFHAPVAFDDVSRYAASADIGLVLHKNTGLNYYYVCPNKLFECMAAGLPMVGSDFPDLKWFIKGYNMGITCDPESPADIAESVNLILSDENTREKMRDNALEAAKIYNWENESRKLVSLYEGFDS